MYNLVRRGEELKYLNHLYSFITVKFNSREVQFTHHTPWSDVNWINILSSLKRKLKKKHTHTHRDGEGGSQEWSDRLINNYLQQQWGSAACQVINGIEQRLLSVSQIWDGDWDWDLRERAHNKTKLQSEESGVGLISLSLSLSLSQSVSQFWSGLSLVRGFGLEMRLA